MFKERKNTIPILVVGFLVLVISSCTAEERNISVDVGQPTSTIQTQATKAPTEPPTEVPPSSIEPSQPVATSIPESVPTATQAPLALPDQGQIPTGSSLLKATDPESVDLADGEPKLVEFFAFW